MAVVFLSSTFAEMHEYRQAARAAIDALGHRCIHMEVFPAADRTSVSFRADKMKECDLFVLLLGKFYGTPIPGRDVSYTEDEFDAAVSLQIPRLVFVPGSRARPNLDAALARMEADGLSYEEQKKRQSAFAKKVIKGCLARDFSDPADLKFQIVNSINHHLQSARPAIAPFQAVRERTAYPGEIFISYASADRPKIKPLVIALERAGWSVWWDRTIRPGKIYDDVIEQALDRAKCVIVIWSEKSVGSEWVRNEAEEARNRGILVPVLLEDVKVPLAFRRIQAARLMDWQGESDGPDFQELCQAITERIESHLQ